MQKRMHKQRRNLRPRTGQWINSVYTVNCDVQDDEHDERSDDDLRREETDRDDLPDES